MNCLFQRAWIDFVHPPPPDRFFRSSGLAGECPLKYYLDIVAPVPPTESRDESVLDIGTWVHDDDNWQLRGANGVPALEQDYYIKLRNPDPKVGEWVVKGSMDRFRIHPRIGFYIEDIKTKETLNANKIYQLLKNSQEISFGFPAYIKQVSMYAFFEYVYNKRVITRGRIRFISQEDPLFELAVPIDLMPWTKVQDFILNHPTIQSCLYHNPQIVIEATRKLHFQPDKFPCSWCDHLPSCPLVKKDPVKEIPKIKDG